MDRRKKMEDVLSRAVKFSADAQRTKRGGWGYISQRRTATTSTKGPSPLSNFRP